MRLRHFTGVLLILFGLLVLAYGSYIYNRNVNAIQNTSVLLSMSDRSNLYMPFWVGIVSVITGGFLLLLRLKKNGKQ